MPQIEISQNAFDYLKAHAEPLVDTTATVLDRLIAEHESAANTANKPPTAALEFRAKDMPSVTHSHISEAKIAGKVPPKRDWNYILIDVIDACVANGATEDQIKTVINANFIEGNVSAKQRENGYNYKPKSVGFTLQGLSAERSCKNIMLLSDEFNIQIDLEICWNGHADPHYAHKKAILRLP